MASESARRMIYEARLVRASHALDHAGQAADDLGLEGAVDDLLAMSQLLAAMHGESIRNKHRRLKLIPLNITHDRD